MSVRSCLTRESHFLADSGVICNFWRSIFCFLLRSALFSVTQIDGFPMDSRRPHSSPEASCAMFLVFASGTKEEEPPDAGMNIMTEPVLNWHRG